MNESVSVILPAYNAASTVEVAVRSILDQSHTDIEVLVIDDGSTDGTGDIVEGIKDSRLRFVRNSANLGLIATLNMGLAMAQGTYIARMDADDRSHPERISKQLQRFRDNPGLVACGTAMLVMDSEGRLTGQTMPTFSGAGFLRWKLFAGTVFHHPTIMIRKAALKGLEYDSEDLHAEDYGLWLKLGENGPLDNLSQPLVDYRVHEKSISQTHKERQVASTVNALARHLRVHYGVQFDPRALTMWSQPRFARTLPPLSELGKVLSWMKPSNPRFDFMNRAERAQAWWHYGRRLTLIAGARLGAIR